MASQINSKRRFAFCPQMMPIMTTSADVLVEELSKKVTQEKEVDVYSVFQCLTLDVIGRCAFGLQTRAQTDRDDEFLTHIRSLFNIMSTTCILPLVSECLGQNTWEFNKC